MILPRLTSLVSLFALPLCVFAQTDEPLEIPPQKIFPAPSLPVDELMGPSIQTSGTMVNEPVLFVKTAGQTLPEGTLLFVPDEILSIRDSALQVTYEPGRDFLWEPGSRRLTLPEGSRIPSRAPSDFYRPPDSSDAIAAATGKHEGEWLLYGESSTVYCDSQVMVTYRHGKDARVLAEPNPADVLPGSIARLKSGSPFKIVLLGDSISEGCNASAMINVPPYLPPYGPLVAEGVRRAYGREVEFVNLSKGGMISDYGVKMLPAVLQEKPDLLIVAFGMNDASHRVDPERYGDAIAQIVRATREHVPHAEFVLVSTMTANPEWSGCNPEMYQKYRGQLLSLKKPGTIVADMTSLWDQLLQKKTYWDLTANGVNHPNDFGHRLYAQTILAALVPPAEK